ncbi:MAG TPA: hypothetical protein VMU02_06280 [bacterium]|nr:hypothetical protein [bacterium]
MKRSAIVMLILVLVFAVQVWAGSGGGHAALDKPLTGTANENIKFALHLVAHATKGCGGKGTPLPVISSFNDIVRRVNGTPTDLDVFLVVFDYDSLSEIEYGLTWPKDWGTASTQVCVPSLAIGTIDTSGAGMAFAWDYATLCKIPQGHPGGNTPAFFVTSYTWLAPSSPGAITISKDPATLSMGVVECREDQYRGYEHIYWAYNAAIDQAPESTYVEPVSWGKIKSIFK